MNKNLHKSAGIAPLQTAAAAAQESRAMQDVQFPALYAAVTPSKYP